VGTENAGIISLDVVAEEAGPSRQTERPASGGISGRHGSTDITGEERREKDTP